MSSITNPNNLNNLSFTQHRQNLLVTNDLATGNILFTSEVHNIQPKVLGTLDAVVDPRSTNATPRIRIRQLNEDGTVQRVLIRRKPTFRFFCQQDGSEGPTRITTSTNRLTSELDVISFLNQLFSEVPATTSTILDFNASDGLDARRDATNTTVLFDNGKEHAVNAILAQENSIGLINITDHATQQIHFRNVRPEMVTISGLYISSDVTTVVNALNALFSVNAFGGVLAPQVIYPTLAGQAVTLNRSEHSLDNGVASTKNVTAGEHNARAWSSEYIDARGEYFDFEMTGTGNFLVGFHDAADTTDIADDSLTSKVDGIYWGLEICDFGDYQAPHAVLGADPTFAYGAGWQSSDALTLYRNNSDIQAAHDNDEAVLFRAGIDSDGYGYISYFDEGRTNEYILLCRTATVIDTLDKQFGLVAKLLTNEAALKEVPQVIGTEVDTPTLQYRWVESPDGQFYYPLFDSEEQANYVDTLNGGAGNGSSHSHTFIDDPTGTTWYMPDNGGFHAVSAGPTDSYYTEIPTEADNVHAPAALNFADQSFTEGNSANFRLLPDGDTATLEILNLPEGLTYANNFITGTVPFVAEDRVYTVTVNRTNSFGTRSESFDISITNNANLGAVPGYTGDYGNLVNVGAYPGFVSTGPDTIGGLLTYDQQLNPGERFSFVQPNTSSGSTIGILNSTGQASAAVADNDNPADLRNKSNWELRFITFGGFIGSNDYRYQLAGWSNDGTISRNSSGNVNSTFDLEYGADGYFRLYQTNYNGNPTKILHKTSASTFTGPQAITVYSTFDSDQSNDRYIPNATVTSLTGSATTPPSGFVSPLTAGQLDGSLLLDNDSVATFTQKLESGKRWVIPAAYVEQNWLPYMDLGKVYMGIPVSGVDWTDVSIGDFKAVVRIHQPDAAVFSHRSQITADGTSDTNTVNSVSQAHWNYAFEWDGTDLHVIAHSNLYDLLLNPGIDEGTTFDRVKTITPATGGDQDVVIAVDEFAAQANLTTSNIHIIDIPTGTGSTLTDWHFALDFSGNPEYARNTAMGYSNNPQFSGGRSGYVSKGSYGDEAYWETHYSNEDNSRPFFLSAVFNPDNQTEDAGIFGIHEGTSGNHDSWYLGIDANNMVYYTVGRPDDGYNRAELFTAPAGGWYGVYVDYSGARLSTPSVTDLNHVFRFFQVDLTTGVATRITANWTTVGVPFTSYSASGHTMVGRTGAPADTTGHFKGKIAACVESTLSRFSQGGAGDANFIDQTKLDATEIGMIVRDPMRWLQEYKVGKPYRRPGDSTVYNNFQLNGTWEPFSTKVWLMGDGQQDSYSKIRNAVRPGYTSYYSLDTHNMVSNDVVSVTIPGLTS